MALERFIPQVWSARILVNLQKAHVFANVANTDYEGEISQYGDTVKINSIGRVSVRDYTKGATITRDELDDAQVLLTIDQAKYFNFGVDDIDRVQQKPKVMDEAMREASYSIADEADKHVASMFTDAEKLDHGAMESSDVYPALVEVNQKLDERNVPRGARWIVVAPWFMGKLVLAKIFEQQGSFAADNVEATGFAGQALGLNIWVSNNLIADHGGTDTLMPAGTRRAVSYAEQILSVEAYRPEDGFEDAVKGLHVYGAKLVDPESCVTLQGRFTAET